MPSLPHNQSGEVGIDSDGGETSFVSMLNNLSTDEVLERLDEVASDMSNNNMDYDTDELESYFLGDDELTPPKPVKKKLADKTVKEVLILNDWKSHDGKGPETKLKLIVVAAGFSVVEFAQSAVNLGYISDEEEEEEFYCNTSSLTQESQDSFDSSKTLSVIPELVEDLESKIEPCGGDIGVKAEMGTNENEKSELFDDVTMVLQGDTSVSEKGDCTIKSADSEIVPGEIYTEPRLTVSLGNNLKKSVEDLDTMEKKFEFVNECGENAKKNKKTEASQSRTGGFYNGTPMEAEESEADVSLEEIIASRYLTPVAKVHSAPINKDADQISCGTASANCVGNEAEKLTDDEKSENGDDLCILKFVDELILDAEERLMRLRAASKVEDDIFEDCEETVDMKEDISFWNEYTVVKSTVIDQMRELLHKLEIQSTDKADELTVNSKTMMLRLKQLFALIDEPPNKDSQAHCLSQRQMEKRANKCPYSSQDIQNLRMAYDESVEPLRCYDREALMAIKSSKLAKRKLSIDKEKAKSVLK